VDLLVNEDGDAEGNDDRMTIEEMFRRIVRAHLVLITICTLLPVSAAVGLELRKEPEWLAAARIQVVATAPKSSTEADGLSSRVLALATTPGLVDSALRAAKVSRDVTDLATHHVTVDRLGESSVVQLSVTDPDPAAAGRIVTALAKQVADFLNKGDRAHFDSALADLDDQIAKAKAHRTRLAAQLRRTHDITERGNVQADIASADQALAQLSEQRAALVLADATRDEAVVIGSKADVRKVPSSIVPQSALALLLGLVLGLTVAAVVETLRPRVAGPRALARLLEAPVLGRSAQPVATLANAMALAARRHGVEAIVLVGADKRDHETIGRLLAELARLAPVAALQPDHRRTPAETQPAASRRDRVPHDGPLASLELEDAAGLLFGNIRFTELSAIRQEDEMTAGVVVLSSGTILNRQVDSLDDILKAVRWPVLGVLDVSGKAASGWSR
jgi:capsular polysaccharide biosynthesis protein